MDGPWNEVLLVWTRAALGFICSSAVLEGYMLRVLTVSDRLILSVASLALFWNGIWLKTAGLAVMALSLWMQHSRPAELFAPAPAVAAVQAKPWDG